mgnify:CR=1 FL=1
MTKFIESSKVCVFVHVSNGKTQGKSSNRGKSSYINPRSAENVEILFQMPMERGLCWKSGSKMQVKFHFEIPAKTTKFCRAEEVYCDRIQPKTSRNTSVTENEKKMNIKIADIFINTNMLFSLLLSLVPR